MNVNSAKNRNGQTIKVGDTVRLIGEKETAKVKAIRKDGSSVGILFDHPVTYGIKAAQAKNVELAN